MTIRPSSTAISTDSPGSIPSCSRIALGLVILHPESIRRSIRMILTTIGPHVIVGQRTVEFTRVHPWWSSLTASVVTTPTGVAPNQWQARGWPLS